jgi:hypothetical protein
MLACESVSKAPVPRKVAIPGSQDVLMVPASVALNGGLDPELTSAYADKRMAFEVIPSMNG